MFCDYVEVPPPSRQGAQLAAALTVHWQQLSWSRNRRQRAGRGPSASQNVENYGPGRYGIHMVFILYHVFAILDRIFRGHRSGMRWICEIRRWNQLLPDRGESANVPAG